MRPRLVLCAALSLLCARPPLRQTLKSPRLASPTRDRSWGAVTSIFPFAAMSRLMGDLMSPLFGYFTMPRRLMIGRAVGLHAALLGRAVWRFWRTSMYADCRLCTLPLGDHRERRTDFSRFCFLDIRA